MSKVWKCQVCGHVQSQNEAPDICPICGVGAEEFVIQRKVLKTGREIWTLGGQG